MSQPAKANTGRVDHLARGVFDKLLKKHANPQIRFACKMLEDEIGEVFEETFGPGTKAHEIGRRVMRAIEGDK